MKARLVKKVVEAKDTSSFYWKTATNISWLPGQFFYFTLPDVFKDPRGPTRQFTIASSPTEGGLLRISTRLGNRSGFKRELSKYPIGGEAEVEGPSGTFIFDEAERNRDHIFLAGGIGVTPFRSFIKYAIDKKIKSRVHLIYSNPSAEEITYKKELEDWDTKNDFFSITQTVTDGKKIKTGWQGKVGRIDKELIREVSSSYNKPNYWIVGPGAFVDTMENYLEELRVGSGQVRTEKFVGY